MTKWRGAPIMLC